MTKIEKYTKFSSMAKSYHDKVTTLMVSGSRRELKRAQSLRDFCELRRDMLRAELVAEGVIK